MLTVITDYYKTNQDNRNSGNPQNTLGHLPNGFYAPSQDYITDDMIFSMMEDKAGNIWFATRDHFEDKNGDLWFTTESDGVWCYDGKAIKNFTENDGLINNAVMNVLEDSAGNLWFGTKWFGLSHYDGKTFMTFSQYEN